MTEYEEFIWEMPDTNRRDFKKLYNANKNDPDWPIERWIETFTIDLPYLRGPVVIFHDGFNLPLGTGNFKEGTVAIHFGKYFKQPLEVGVFPSTVQKITFGNYYGRKSGMCLQEGVFPEGLLVLRYMNYAKCSIEFAPNVLPNTLIFLEIGSNSSVPIGPNILPNSLEILSGNTSFTEDFKFPLNIKILRTGTKFNIEITPDNLIKLERLTLCKYPYELVPGSLPNTCIEIILHDYNLKLVPGSLPANLKKLVIYGYNHAITKHCIPKSLESFELDGYLPIRIAWNEDYPDVSGEELETGFFIPLPNDGNMKFIDLGSQQVRYDEDTDEEGGNFYEVFKDHHIIKFYGEMAKNAIDNA